MAAPETVLTGPQIGFWAAFAALLRRPLANLLKRIEIGNLTLTLPSGVSIHHRGARPGPNAVIHIVRWRTLWRLVLSSDLGLARAYIEDECGSPDLRALLEFGARNASARKKVFKGFPLARLVARVRHARRKNSPAGSRRNIAAHYDLGNAFYALWLDRGMNYSSALFNEAGQTLEQAQDAKLARVVDLLDVRQGQRVLEIGCGWGPLAERLAAGPARKVTGITLSAQQLVYAQSRLQRCAALSNCDFSLKDYRNVDQRYDRIVSIEMLEAVGEQYWPIYFDKLRRSLDSNGLAVLQAITIAEARLPKYRARPDFIQQYIFPGGMLPTLSTVMEHAGRAGLRLVARESFGSSYAKTLAEWRHRFLRAWPQIEALGFDTRFKRMWEYYLTYCEVGFTVGAIDVHLIKLAAGPSTQF